MSEEEKIDPSTDDSQPATENESVDTELTENPEPSTITNEPSTNMEVHAHTHSGHGKKTWREYFWEFLMLFLAVFCGFLAEWQLEHVIEHSREKEYMESMVIDIHTDSVNLANMSKSFGLIKTDRFFNAIVTG
jgi:hypothetical protein